MAEQNYMMIKPIATSEVIKQTSRCIWLCTVMFLLYINLISCSHSEICDYILEAEEGNSLQRLMECNTDNFYTPCMQFRSQASGRSHKLTVKFTRSNQYISYRITSPSQCTLQISDIIYSNDEGGADNISVLLGNIYVGDFITHQMNSGMGDLWDEFHSSGQIGDVHTIFRGENLLIIRVSVTDSKGVELDKIDVSFNDCHGKCPIVSAVTPLISHNRNGDDDNNGGESLSNELIIGITYGIGIVLLALLTIVTGFMLYRSIKYRNYKI